MERKNDGAGFCVYIGPSIRGVVQKGHVYIGDRESAWTEAARAIQYNPLIKSLIVTGDRLNEARVESKTPGTALYKNYRRVLLGK